MINRNTLLAFAAAALLLGAPHAFAWGPAGHRIVAHIAELRLTDHTHQALAQLLYASNQISDNMVCNWPDYVRRDMPETGPWHFVDIPKDAEGYDAERDCPEDQCIVAQIFILEKSIADETKSIEDRNIALRFLVHFLGDLHQPLHASDYDNDHGGNTRMVILPGDEKPMRLHAAWDSYILYTSMKPLGALEYADKLNDKISNRRARLWSRGTPADWANDSFHVSMETAYAVVPPADGTAMQLDNDYLKNAQKAITLQLMKGGIRLAAILNRAMENVHVTDAIQPPAEVHEGHEELRPVKKAAPKKESKAE